MDEIIVSDASCLILLQKIDELHLLKKLFSKIYITNIVFEEINFQLPEWFEIKNPTHQNYQHLLEIILDEGEASAIALSLENPHSILLIDERKGRNIAEKLGIQIKGTLGVLIDSKKKSLVKEVKPILHKILQTNFRLSNELVKLVLEEVNEIP